ncbi:MAG: hypothetical protein LIO46_03975 [Clostridiales bacterium]|nr:hypothetical protein [Clostridiales bacterium]
MLDMNKLCDTAGLTRYEEELSSNKALFEALFHQSMEMMAAQKAVHDKVEEIYKPSMDFGGVDACTAALIERLKRVQPGSR